MDHSRIHDSLCGLARRAKEPQGIAYQRRGTDDDEVLEDSRAWDAEAWWRQEESMCDCAFKDTPFDANVMTNA